MRQVMYKYRSNSVKAYTRFSDDEIEFIKDNYLILPDDHIARALRRSVISVEFKRKSLRLIKPRGKPIVSNAVHTPQEIQREINALENFIEVTKYVLWKEIALTRKMELIKQLVILRKQAKDKHETPKSNFNITS